MNELEAALRDVEDLLRQCGEESRADWISQRRAVIAAGGPDTEAARKDVTRALAGMGSLSDIWLEPRPDAGLSTAEVERRRADLLDRLDRLLSDEPAPAGPSNADLPPRDP